MREGNIREKVVGELEIAVHRVNPLITRVSRTRFEHAQYGYDDVW